MKPAALLGTTALVFFVLYHQPARAQAVPTRFEVMPIQSGIYQQTVNVYVYRPAAAPAGEASLPVVYVPLLSEKDTACLARLEQMMQRGTLPYMRLVAVERTGSVAPAVYVSPKRLEDVEVTDDEWFCRFLAGEVMPAVEGAYPGNAFRALYVDEASSLGGYMVANHSSSYSACLSPEDFVWFSEGRPPARAKTFAAYYTGLRAQKAVFAAAETDQHGDEFFLKTGKGSWPKQ